MNLIHRLPQGVTTLKKTVVKLSLPKKIFILILIASIGWFGIRPILVGGQKTAVSYQTEQAEKGTLITSVTASGIISSGNKASIKTSVSGTVNQVYVQNGDSVTQGQTIATMTLDQSSLQKQAAAWASYLAAQNAVNASKSKMNTLQAELFTASDTFTNGAGTKTPDVNDAQYIIERAKWLQAEANYTQQDAVIKQSEAALSSAWLSYALTSGTITAPMTGVVSNLTLTPGLSVSGGSSSSTSSTSTSTSDSSESLGAITLPDGKIQAAVNISEIDITTVEVGQKVTITMDAFPDKTFTGIVTSIDTDGSVSSGVTTYPVTITLDSAIDKMYPNMAVSATIITSIKDSVLLVPSSSVKTTNGQSTVDVLNKGVVTTKDVTVGASNDTQTEILSGISAGDTIVTSQTGGTTTTTQTGTSPFSGGFGAARGAGTGGAIRIQR